MLIAEGTHHLHLDQAEDVFRTTFDFLVDPALCPNRGVVPDFKLNAKL